MALDYELRSEFTNLPLETLMDHAVTCFQGVGDNQNELLQKYFGVHSIRDLANLPFFSMALEVQKAALEGNGSRSASVADLSQKRELAFTVREQDQDLTVQELLDAPIQALEGLSPAQSLALYDAFRITNIRQLAHNRIMIESRIIQYLDHHGPEAADISGTPDEMLAVLAGDRPDLPSQGGSRVDETDVREDEQELTEHVRGRLDALRARARQRAKSIPDDDGELSRADRISAMRESRDRLDGVRGQLGVGASRGAGQEEGRVSARDRVAALRAGAAGGSTAESLAAIRERESSRRGVTSTTRSRIEALSAARSGAGGGTAAGGRSNGSTASTRSPSSASSRPSLAAQAKQEMASPAPQETPAPAPRRTRQRTPNYGPILVAAAVALLVVIGLIVWFNRSGDAPPVAEESATQGGQMAGTASGDGTATGAAAAGGTSTATAGDGTATTASVTRQPPAPTGPIHVVQRGNSLWRISRMYYKNPLMWPEIFEANRDKIRDPDLIYPNQRFVIPER